MRRTYGWTIVVTTYSLALVVLAFIPVLLDRYDTLERASGNKETVIFSLVKRMAELDVPDKRIQEVDDLLRQANRLWANIPPGAIVSTQRFLEQKRYQGNAKESLATTDKARALAKQLVEAHATTLVDPVFSEGLAQLDRFNRLELLGYLILFGGSLLALTLLGLQFALEKRQLIEPPKFARLT